MMLEDEIKELMEANEQVGIPPEEQASFEEAAEEEHWNICLRCGARDHYARWCPIFPTGKRVFA